MTERSDRIRVATWNVKHGAYADKYLGHPRKVAEACKSLGAHILALQEVDKWVPRSGFRNMAGLAAKASGMVPVFERTMRFYCGSYGNALLVRGDIEDYDVLKLQGGYRFQLGDYRIPLRREPRNAILATVRIGERRLSVAATHLSTQREISRVQLPKVIDALSDMPGPHVLIGDLNLPKREVLAHLSGSSIELADGPPTSPASNPKRSIDHIAVNGLRICTVDAVTLPISDHSALVAEVE